MKPTSLMGVLQEMAKLSLSRLLLLGSVAPLGSALVHAWLGFPTSLRYTMGQVSIPTVGLSRTAVITVLPGWLSLDCLPLAALFESTCGSPAGQSTLYLLTKEMIQCIDGVQQSMRPAEVIATAPGLHPANAPKGDQDHRQASGCLFYRHFCRYWPGP